MVPTLHWEKGAPGPGVTASEPPAATAPRQRPREPAGSQSAVREELRTELKTESLPVEAWGHGEGTNQERGDKSGLERSMESGVRLGLPGLTEVSRAGG